MSEKNFGKHPSLRVHGASTNQVGPRAGDLGPQTVHDANGYTSHQNASAPHGTTELDELEDGAALGPKNTPAGRIRKSTLQRGGSAVMDKIRAFYSRGGIDHEAIAAIKARRDGPSWTEARNKEIRHSPQMDAARASVGNDIARFYQGGGR